MFFFNFCYVFLNFGKHFEFLQILYEKKNSQICFDKNMFFFFAKIDNLFKIDSVFGI